MANRSAFVALVGGVQSYFAANAITAVVAAGWREPAKQTNQGPGRANRVVFVPGDERGNAGDLVRGQKSSTNPRVLLEWRLPITMYCWAVDTSDRNNELLQIAALDNLFELAVQGVHNAVDASTGTPLGFGNIEWGSVRYVTDNTEVYFGRELICSFTLRTRLLDAAVDTTTPLPGVARALVVP